MNYIKRKSEINLKNEKKNLILLYIRYKGIGFVNIKKNESVYFQKMLVTY